MTYQIQWVKPRHPAAEEKPLKEKSILGNLKRKEKKKCLNYESVPQQRGSRMPDYKLRKRKRMKGPQIVLRIMP